MDHHIHPGEQIVTYYWAIIRFDGIVHMLGMKKSLLRCRRYYLPAGSRSGETGSKTDADDVTFTIM
jgi:hypothetical protein